LCSHLPSNSITSGAMLLLPFYYVVIASKECSKECLFVLKRKCSPMARPDDVVRRLFCQGQDHAHMQSLTTLLPRTPPATRRCDTTFACCRGKDFSRYTSPLPISDFQARGAGLSKGPSFLAATNMSMTRSYTKAWKFTNNQHDTRSGPAPRCHRLCRRLRS
jgi:hypothetical protein